MSSQIGVDICFVVDMSDSMRPILESFKQKASFFGDWTKEVIESPHQMQLQQLRVRFIGFGNVSAMGDDAFFQTPFMSLPQQNQQFCDAVNQLYKCAAANTSTLAPNTWQALWLAVNSDWTMFDRFTQGRNIIVLLTDKVPQAFDQSQGGAAFAQCGLPDNIDVIANAWLPTESTGYLRFSRRIIFHAPEPADTEMRKWNNAYFFYVDEGCGMIYDCVEDIIVEIARSVY